MWDGAQGAGRRGGTGYRRKKGGEGKVGECGGDWQRAVRAVTLVCWAFTASVASSRDWFFVRKDAGWKGREGFVLLPRFLCLGVPIVFVFFPRWADLAFWNNGIWIRRGISLLPAPWHRSRQGFARWGWRRTAFWMSGE